jgi:hypothetical protein
MANAKATRRAKGGAGGAGGSGAGGSVARSDTAADATRPSAAAFPDGVVEGILCAAAELDAATVGNLLGVRCGARALETKATRVAACVVRGCGGAPRAHVRRAARGCAGVLLRARTPAATACAAARDVAPTTPCTFGGFVPASVRAPHARLTLPTLFAAAPQRALPRRGLRLRRAVAHRARHLRLRRRPFPAGGVLFGAHCRRAARHRHSAARLHLRLLLRARHALVRAAAPARVCSSLRARGHA